MVIKKTRRTKAIRRKLMALLAEVWPRTRFDYEGDIRCKDDIVLFKVWPHGRIIAVGANNSCVVDMIGGKPSVFRVALNVLTAYHRGDGPKMAAVDVVEHDGVLLAVWGCE